MLKRDRTSEERIFDAKIRTGLMRLGENSSLTSRGDSSRVTNPHQPPNSYPHFLYWDRLGRKGQKCRILQPGHITARDLQVEFEDGFVAVVNRRAIRRSQR